MTIALFEYCVIMLTFFIRYYPNNKCTKYSYNFTFESNIYFIQKLPTNFYNFSMYTYVYV